VEALYLDITNAQPSQENILQKAKMMREDIVSLGVLLDNPEHSEKKQAGTQVLIAAKLYLKSILEYVKSLIAGEDLSDYLISINDTKEGFIKRVQLFPL